MLVVPRVMSIASVIVPVLVLVVVVVMSVRPRSVVVRMRVGSAIRVGMPVRWFGLGAGLPRSRLGPGLHGRRARRRGLHRLHTESIRPATTAFSTHEAPRR